MMADSRNKLLSSRLNLERIPKLTKSNFTEWCIEWSIGFAMHGEAGKECKSGEYYDVLKGKPVITDYFPYLPADFRGVVPTHIRLIDPSMIKSYEDDLRRYHDKLLRYDEQKLLLLAGLMETISTEVRNGIMADGRKLDKIIENHDSLALFNMLKEHTHFTAAQEQGKVEKLWKELRYKPLNEPVDTFLRRWNLALQEYEHSTKTVVSDSARVYQLSEAFNRGLFAGELEKMYTLPQGHENYPKFDHVCQLLKFEDKNRFLMVKHQRLMQLDKSMRKDQDQKKSKGSKRKAEEGEDTVLAQLAEYKSKFGPLVDKRTTTRSSKRPFQCYKCGKEGHTKANCPHLLKPEQPKEEKTNKKPREKKRRSKPSTSAISLSSEVGRGEFDSYAFDVSSVGLSDEGLESSDSCENYPGEESSTDWDFGEVHMARTLKTSDSGTESEREEESSASGDDCGILI